MARLSELAPTIRTSLGKIPTFVVDRELLATAQVFLQETEVWNETREVEAMAGDEDLLWMPPRGADIYRVVWLSLEGRKLDPVPMATFGEHRLNTRASRPTRFTQDSLGKVLVNPIPDKTYSGLVHAVYTIRNGDEIPDRLLHQHKSTIMDGTLATLFMMDTEWGSNQKGRMFWERFQLGIDRAKRRAFRDNSNLVRTTGYGGI